MPSVRPSVLPYATEPVATWPVRPAEITTGPEPAAQRSRSHTPMARPSTPLLRRQPNVLVTDPTRILSVHSPPPAPPPSPIPNLSQYLGSDDDSLSSDTTTPPAQRELPPVQRADRRTSVVSSRYSRSIVEVSADAIGLARQLAGRLQEQLQQATNREVRQADEATSRELRLQQEALEKERRQFSEARQLQGEATARELRRVRVGRERTGTPFPIFFIQRERRSGIN